MPSGSEPDDCKRRCPFYLQRTYQGSFILIDELGCSLRLYSDLHAGEVPSFYRVDQYRSYSRAYNVLKRHVTLARLDAVPIRQLLLCRLREDRLRQPHILGHQSAL